jgi:type VI protein secretion system component VasK
MIRRITGIILGVVAFFLVYWLTGGTATPATPNWALAILIGLVVALVWPWIFGLIVVRRSRQRRQDEINQEVQKQLAEQQKNPPAS